MLTAAQLHSRVLDLNPATAIFDCDGTLWSADAGYGFMQWSLEQQIVSPEATRYILLRYERYRRGEVSEEAICGDMTTLYAGLDEHALRRAAEQFFQQHIAPTTFPAMRQLVAALAARGTELWAVSSTNIWVIQHGVEAFGIPPEHVLAARVCVQDGRATAQLLDVPTGPAKATALVAAGITQPDCCFGNSIHDAAMLATARAPFAINPSPALLELALDQGWPVYQPLASAELPA